MGATPRGNLALAAVNAAVGDRLAERRSPQAGPASKDERISVLRCRNRGRISG
jgi:hypothetical protein